MIPFPKRVIDEFLEGPSEMALPERHDPIEGLVFGIGVRIGRLKRVSARHARRPGPASVAHPGSLPVTVTDQHPMIAQQPSVAVCVRPTWRIKGSFGCGADLTICHTP